MKAALQLASFGVMICYRAHQLGGRHDRSLHNAFPAEQQPQIRGMLSDSLAGVVSQQLVKRADGSGRVAAHEILIATSGLGTLIRDGKTNQVMSMIQSGQGEGMQSMDSALDRLVRGASRRRTPWRRRRQGSFAKIPAVARVIRPTGCEPSTSRCQSVPPPDRLAPVPERVP
jgi:Tfp pilus assembly pilus retraction ATPase PilT